MVMTTVDVIEEAAREGVGEVERWFCHVRVDFCVGTHCSIVIVCVNNIVCC